MGFCSFSKEYTQNMYTFIENQFITKYLPLADANSVKVYLFGLYLCQNASQAFTLEDMAKELQLSTAEVEQGFLFWEDFDLLKVISKNPFCVQFYPVSFSKGKPKKIRTDKYFHFTKALQALFPDKMISSNEYMKYFNFMEENAMQPDAMLLIINYCIGIKGKNIRSNYILQVAKDWVADDIRTASQIESKLENFKPINMSMQKLLDVMQPKTPPRPQDFAALEKWTESYKFTIQTMLQLIQEQKITTFTKLDTILTKLYEAQLIEWKAIENYFSQQQQNRQLTIKLAKTLGVYCSNIDTYIENFTEKWKALGYTDSSLLDLAKFAFQNNKKSFEEMHTFVESLYAQNICNTASIQTFFERERQENDFLKALFSKCGITKAPTAWDREQLRQWRNWQFNDALLLKAAALSFGKQNTMAYLNGILRSWKEKNLLTVEAVEQENSLTITKTSPEDREKELHKKVAKEYFNLRENAIAQAEYYQKQAEAIDGFKELQRQIKILEIDSSKATALGQSNAEELTQQLNDLQAEKIQLLLKHKIDPKKLQPNYSCRLCNDTGFDKNNNYCVCYLEKLEKLKNNN